MCVEVGSQSKEKRLQATKDGVLLKVYSSRRSWKVPWPTRLHGPLLLPVFGCGAVSTLAVVGGDPTPIAGRPTTPRPHAANLTVPSHAPTVHSSSQLRALNVPASANCRGHNLLRG